jgi:hypothetical protein
MDAEDRLAGIVIAAEDAGTCLATAFSALIGYRSENLWFLADSETCVLHPTMMPQAVALKPCRQFWYDVSEFLCLASIKSNANLEPLPISIYFSRQRRSTIRKRSLALNAASSGR